MRVLEGRSEGRFAFALPATTRRNSACVEIRECLLSSAQGLNSTNTAHNVTRTFGNEARDASGLLASSPRWDCCMTTLHPIVFLIDVGNTLLDNEAIQQDLGDHIERRLHAPPRLLASSLETIP
jgi:hypothetical protein